MLREVHDLVDNIFKHLHGFADAVLSYLTVGMAFTMTLPWMQIGGAVLLVARLIVDLPPAYARIKEWMSRSR